MVSVTITPEVIRFGPRPSSLFSSETRQWDVFWTRAIIKPRICFFSPCSSSSALSVFYHRPSDYLVSFILRFKPIWRVHFHCQNNEGRITIMRHFYLLLYETTCTCTCIHRTRVIRIVMALPLRIMYSELQYTLLYLYVLNVLHVHVTSLYLYIVFSCPCTQAVFLYQWFVDANKENQRIKYWRSVCWLMNDWTQQFLFLNKEGTRAKDSLKWQGVISVPLQMATRMGCWVTTLWET